jgi:hypothetical protein
LAVLDVNRSLDRRALDRCTAFRVDQPPDERAQRDHGDGNTTAPDDLPPAALRRLYPAARLQLCLTALAPRIPARPGIVACAGCYVLRTHWSLSWHGRTSQTDGPAREAASAMTDDW